MKHIITQSIKHTLSDRTLLLMSLFILGAGLSYVIYVVVSLNASDLQLATRYTSFGNTHFYRDKWYYLLSFVGFGFLFMVVHIGGMIKLYVNEMRPLAVALGWLSLFMILMMFSYTYHVLSIAYLR